MAQPDRIILGIDPGTTIMGFGVLDATGKNPGFIDMGMLDLRKEGDHYQKLNAIFRSTVKLIENYAPMELAIEAPFYGKNIQSMLKLGRAQGVAIAAALSMDLPVFEYAPRKIKLAITGGGQSSKEQVAGMLARMFMIKNMPDNLDATDGLAVAVCHFYEKGSPQKKSTVKNWEDFVRKNPGRVK
ncbi:MAG: crossover junction endodeoxyribonuclease RuvC [Bacteroidales bacterium]